jgi:hypothetical protein
VEARCLGSSPTVPPSSWYKPSPCWPGSTRLSRKPPARDAPGRDPGQLSDNVSGTSKRKKEKTSLARLVLRGIARSHGTELPRDARGRRELWEAAGVAVDQVSSTVLTG